MFKKKQKFKNIKNEGLTRESKKLWIEEHRPKTFSEIKGQYGVIRELSGNVSNLNLSHLILKGPAGTGKTTTAFVIAKVVYGDDYRQNFMEMNAGDKRTINDMRGTVSNFAKYAPFSGPFKILFLDEADALTEDSQKLLNRLMEKYGNNCRFILCVNDVERLLETIRSRCTEYQYNTLSGSDIVERLREIAEERHLQLNSEAFDSIAIKAGGDLRKAVNYLQMNHTQFF